MLNPARTRCEKPVVHTCSRSPSSAEKGWSVYPGFETKDAGDTYRYEGRAAQRMLKNRITKHESRNPNPKAAGPTVPAENLRNTSRPKSVRERGAEITNGREDVKVRREPNKKDLVVLCIRSGF